MNVSYENIVENENCYLVDINLEPSKNLKNVPEKFNSKKRSPLKECSGNDLKIRLENAEKRKSQHLNEIKQKSVLKTEKISTIQAQQQEKIQQVAQKTTERIKSANSKRDSLLKEKIEKCQKSAMPKEVTEDHVNYKRFCDPLKIKESIDTKLAEAEKRRQEIIKASKSELTKKVSVTNVTKE